MRVTESCLLHAKITFSRVCLSIIQMNHRYGKNQTFIERASLVPFHSQFLYLFAFSCYLFRWEQQSNFMDMKIWNEREKCWIVGNAMEKNPIHLIEINSKFIWFSSFVRPFNGHYIYLYQLDWSNKYLIKVIFMENCSFLYIYFQTMKFYYALKMFNALKSTSFRNSCNILLNLI